MKLLGVVAVLSLLALFRVDYALSVLDRTAPTIPTTLAPIPSPNFMQSHRTPQAVCDEQCWKRQVVIL